MNSQTRTNNENTAEYNGIVAQLNSTNMFQTHLLLPKTLQVQQIHTLQVRENIHVNMHT